MKRNEDELNRPVYRQALAHSCLLLRFLSTGGEANDSKKKILCGFWYPELFSTSAHTGPLHGGQGACVSAAQCLDSSLAQPPAAGRARERRQQTMLQLANMSRQQRAARHRRVAAEVAASDASS